MLLVASQDSVALKLTVSVSLTKQRLERLDNSDVSADIPVDDGEGRQEEDI